MNQRPAVEHSRGVSGPQRHDHGRDVGRHHHGGGNGRGDASGGRRTRRRSVGELIMDKLNEGINNAVGHRSHRHGSRDSRHQEHSTASSRRPSMDDKAADDDADSEYDHGHMHMQGSRHQQRQSSTADALEQSDSGRGVAHSLRVQTQGLNSPVDRPPVSTFVDRGPRQATASDADAGIRNMHTSEATDNPQENGINSRDSPPHAPQRPRVRPAVPSRPTRPRELRQSSTVRTRAPRTPFADGTGGPSLQELDEAGDELEGLPTASGGNGMLDSGKNDDRLAATASVSRRPARGSTTDTPLGVPQADAANAGSEDGDTDGPVARERVFSGDTEEGDAPQGDERPDAGSADDGVHVVGRSADLALESFRGPKHEGRTGSSSQSVHSAESGTINPGDDGDGYIDPDADSGRRARGALFKPASGNSIRSSLGRSSRSLLGVDGHAQV